MPNVWTGGFTADVRITNNGAAREHLDGSPSRWPRRSRLTSGWNGTWSQTGTTLTVRNATWNGTLATGATTATGFQGTFTGSSLPTPTNFTLNGAACTS